MPGYDHRRFQQYDTQECLMYLLNQIYPDNSIPEENVFRTSFSESILCQNCYTDSKHTSFDNMCQILLIVVTIQLL